MDNRFPYISRNGIGVGVLRQPNISSYDAASLTYFATAESLDASAFDQTAVDPTQDATANKKQIDTVIKGLKSASLWDPLVEAWWFRDTSFAALPVKLKHSAVFPDLVNKRMYFDGSGVYVDSGVVLGDEDDLEITAKFVNTLEEEENRYLFGYGSQNLVALIDNGKITVLARTTNGSYINAFGQTAIESGTVYTIKLVVDSGYINIYLDDALEATTPILFPVGNDISRSFAIGRRQVDFIYGDWIGLIWDVTLIKNGVTMFSYLGYGNTDADWEDQIGSNDGTVNGSPALYTGQGGNSSVLTLNNYVSADYLSEGTDPGLLGNDSTKTETTTYTATVTGSIAVFTSNGSFYGECEIPTSYTSSQYNLGRKECLFIFNRALTSGERTSLETIMVNQGARPFGLKAGVTSLNRSFQVWSILTSFDDSWDTSAVTDFFAAWYSNSLTSFPLLNTSSGTDFRNAWRDNSLLTDFPANFFDTWNPASINSGVFDLTWDNCTSLTSQSVENILVSLDTSGKYGTDTGLSGGTVLGDNTIDIDYDGSGLTAATTTAITNLKAKDWQVKINGVLQ